MRSSLAYSFRVLSKMPIEDTLMPVNEKTIKTLIEAVRRVSSSLDLDEVLNTIFDSIKELIDYSAAVIYVIDARSGEVDEFKTRGYLPESISEDFLATGGGIIGWVIRNRAGEIVDDVKSDTRYVRVRAETRSEVAAPIIRNDGSERLRCARPRALDDVRVACSLGDRSHTALPAGYAPAPRRK